MNDAWVFPSSPEARAKLAALAAGHEGGASEPRVQRRSGLRILKTSGGRRARGTLDVTRFGLLTVAPSEGRGGELQRDERTMVGLGRRHGAPPLHRRASRRPRRVLRRVCVTGLSGR